jgi:hypothetical protein
VTLKKFITNAEFNQVLELLGLPGETISIEIRGRRSWVMTGVNSGWAMRAVIGGQDGEPYTERVVYVPVLLPQDVTPAEGLM